MEKSSTKELAFVDYWDGRYRAEEKESPETNVPYEWFRTFDQLREFFEENLPPADDGPKILQLGCGTSSLTHDLFLIGFTNQSSIDFSPVAIETMRCKHRDIESLEWRVMDVRKIDYENASFDIAIDKGTLDAMLYGSLWDPEEEVKRNTKAYVDEIARILRPGGKWLYITYRQPHFLRPLLQRDAVWKTEVHALEAGSGGFEYFGFVMTKFHC